MIDLQLEDGRSYLAEDQDCALRPCLMVGVPPRMRVNKRRSVRHGGLALPLYCIRLAEGRCPDPVPEPIPRPRSEKP